MKFINSIFLIFTITVTAQICLSAQKQKAPYEGSSSNHLNEVKSDESNSVQTTDNNSKAENFSENKSTNDSENKNEFKPESILVPIVYYTPETSLAAGLINIRNYNQVAPGRVSQVQLVGAYTSKQQTIVALTPRFYFNNGNNEIYGNINYSYYPNKYYGQLDFHLNTPEAYTENVLKSSIGATHNFIPLHFGRIQFVRNQFNILKTESNSQLSQLLQTNGFANSEQMTVSVGIDRDSRDYPMSPKSGHFLKNQIHFHKFKDLDNDQQVYFQSYDIDWRFYNSLSDKLVLVNQFFAGHLSKSEIPFQAMYSIGGNNSMRGYYNGQYRHQELIMNQNEVRGTITDKWGWDTFFSLAKLGSRWSDIRDSYTHLSAGGGINYLLDPKSRVKIRLNAGFSKENSGVYFVLGESF